jgi:hypothetical protein
VDPCYCCTERMAVRSVDGRRMYDGRELVRLSQLRTQTLRREMGL